MRAGRQQALGRGKGSLFTGAGLCPGSLPGAGCCGSSPARAGVEDGIWLWEPGLHGA